MNRVTIAAALACAACGNYSTEDLEFLSALPARENLRAQVPAGGTTSALTACTGIGTANVWLEAKPASDGWNAGVDLVVGLVDAVRRYPPTGRDDDLRTWGPFADDRHPGREIRVVMTREHPPELNGDPRFAYVFQARPKGTQAYVDLISGVFDGPSAARGKGGVTLDFEAFWALQMNDANTPHGTMRILYDRTGDPVSILLTLAQGGFGMEQFDYAYRGYSGGSGSFAYRFRNAAGDVLTVQTAYDAAGAGEDQVSFLRASDGATGGFQQCWDPAACLVYVNDPFRFTSACGVAASCGDATACAAVPEPLF